MDKLTRPLYRLEKGKGRTKVYLTAWGLGHDILVCAYNRNIHMGAVAVSQFDDKSSRVFTSTITATGHKDDAVAQKIAYAICKHTRKATCVIAGLHIDNITETEIAEILHNTDELAEEFAHSLTLTGQGSH
ncbi:MAG: hypothetical protein ABIH70_04855 [Chloroflexota bacterium]